LAGIEGELFGGAAGARGGAALRGGRNSFRIWVEFKVLGRNAAVPAAASRTPTAGTAAFLTLPKTLDCTLRIFAA
jgi:hypothetical protein